jgi:glycerol-3-phosphate dehydrogenase subunit B
MTAELVVVGGGAAGTAAAWLAKRSGLEVTLVHHLPGATELYSGALAADDDASTAAMDDDLRGLVRALGLWSLEPRGHRIATGAGVVRRARGIDQALLDLEPLSGLRIAVADVEREHYDGKSLACALGASDWARTTRTRFEPVRVDLLRREQERRYTHHGFAELHDSAERIEWLAERLSRASLSHDAWLLGPWLGLEPAAIAQLRLALLRPVGETTSLPGGAAGDRFRCARDRMLEELGVEVVRARAERLNFAGGLWEVELASTDSHTTQVLTAAALVVGVGGLVSGGIELVPPGARGRAFRLSLDAPVELGVDGAALDTVCSLHGPALDRLGPSVLDRVGVLTERSSVRGARQLFAAGACMADRPRTVLEAVESGIAAARAVLRRSARPPPPRHPEP